ncbi:MAG: YhfZ family protein [Christensenellales bacterium]|jgi:hypothetical protein
MTDSTQFYQKNGLVIILLSRDLLNLSEGDRMTPIAEYEKRFGFSRWTIQTAIRFLLDNNCARFVKRGPKGTFVYDLDYKKLWSYTGWDPLLGLAPLPSSRIHDALLTGLYEVFDGTKVPFNLSYMLPGSRRFEALNSKQRHFIITTKLAARLMKEKYPKIRIAVELTGSKYCEPYKLYFSDPEENRIRPGMKVAIYEAAIEQSYISERAYQGVDVVRVYGNYHDCVNWLESKEVDALVQRSDVIPWDGVSLSHLGLDDEVTTPVILVDSDNYGIEKLISRHVDTKKVARIQALALSGTHKTRYF